MNKDKMNTKSDYEKAKIAIAKNKLIDFGELKEIPEEYLSNELDDSDNIEISDLSDDTPRCLDDLADLNEAIINWTKDIADETIDNVHIAAYVGYPDNKSFAVIKFVMLRDETARGFCSRRIYILAAFQTYVDLYLDNLLNTLGYDISEVYQVDKISDNQIELTFVINPYEYVTGIKIDFMGSYNVFMEDIINLMKKGEVVNVPEVMVSLIGKSIAIAGERGINLFMDREALVKKAFDMIDNIWGDDKDEN
jgi:hypothetical protein